jgi:hypothetical protein
MPLSTTPKQLGVDGNCARASEERLAIATPNTAASAKNVRVILIENMSMIPQLLFAARTWGALLHHYRPTSS